MLGQVWQDQWIPGWFLTNFHLNNIFVAQKLAELNLGERCWRNTWTGPDLCGRTTMLVCWGGITLCSWKQARNNWKTSKIVGFERKKNAPMVPPLDRFQGEKWKWLISCQNDQRVERIIFCKLDHFWAALWTKKSLPSQNRVFENGVFFEIFKVIGPEEIPILIGGRRKRPPIKMRST